MAQRSFFDTNVLIYSVDRADPAKQTIALGLIARHAKERTGVISTQVLQEFFAAATRKLGLEPTQARQLRRDFRVFDIVQVTPEIIEEGVDCSILNTLSFWDELIVASAAAAKCAELLSEDPADSRIVQGGAVRKPFGWPVLGLDDTWEIRRESARQQNGMVVEFERAAWTSSRPYSRF